MITQQTTTSATEYVEATTIIHSGGLEATSPLAAKISKKTFTGTTTVFILQDERQMKNTSDFDWMTIDTTYHVLANHAIGLSPATIVGMAFSLSLFMIGLLLTVLYRRHIFTCGKKQDDSAHMESNLSDDLAQLAFPFSKLEFVSELGRGLFGVVREARALDLDLKGVATTVAAKTSYDSNSDYIEEARVLADFKHENIVQLRGLCCDQTSGRITCLLFEHMNGGDLCGFLRRNGPNSTLFQPDDGSTLPHFYTQQITLDLQVMFNIAMDICEGMEYLANKNFIHRDLATRNCLISIPDLRVKISDFGLTRNTYNSDYYKTSKEESVPIRWMPPESILYARYSTMSDVWAYGTTLWEVYSFALQPYFGMSNEEVILCVCQGGILSCPDDTPHQMYDLMQMCWQFDPHDRPSFTDISSILRQINDFYGNLHVSGSQELLP